MAAPKENKKFNRTLVWAFAVIVLVGLLIVAGNYYRGYIIRTNPAKGVAAFNANDVDGTIALADQMIAIDPNNVMALLQKATALAQKGSLGFKEKEYGEQAIEVAKKVLEISPNHLEAMRLIGYSNEIMGKYDEANKWYTDALKIAPKHPDILAQQAHMYDLMGDREKADAGYAAALAINPDITLAQLGAAKGYLRADKPDEARAMYEKVGASAENARQKSEGYYSAGVVAGVQGDHVAAEQLMRQAIAADSSYALAWFGLANELNEKYVIDDGDKVIPSESERIVAITESFAALHKAIELNPEQTVAYLQLGTQLLARGDMQEAYENFQKAAEVVKTDITISEDERSQLAYNILLMNVMTKQRLGIE